MPRPRTAVALAIGLASLVVVVPALVGLLDGSILRAATDRAAGDVAGLALALGVFGAAFAGRAVAWTRVQPGLGFGQALAGIHVALGANHVLPFRLGEPLRIVSVVRRAGVPWASATASTVVLRSADVVVLLLLGLVVGPVTLRDVLGPVGLLLGLVVAVIGVGAAVVVRRRHPASLRLPDGATMALVAGAWLAEAVLVWQVARWFGVDLTAAEAVVVLAAAVGAQLVAVAPGGLGTYEAAGVAALTATGVDPATALALAVGIHATKTGYSLVAGVVGALAPTPNLLGNWRLPVDAPPRPSSRLAAGPVVLFLPAFDEGPRVAEVVARAPRTLRGHAVEVVVVDDGSRDDTAERARAAGASVVTHEHNRGLGAAVRTGLRDAVDRDAVAIAFCDADLEYDPADLEDLVGPVLDGDADYVVGSRFAGRIHHMRPHRRLGNRVLTRWLAWMVRQDVTDGQSGYRAFSPAAAADAEIPHDYNYAQVLTIDLLGKGFRYHEVGIAYRFRQSGDSFVRLGRYLRSVLPTVWRQLNPAPDLVRPSRSG